MGITRRKSAADIDARITAVEDLHFSNTERQAFKAAMKAAAEQMDDDLYKAFDSKTHVLPFLADTLDYSTTILSDQWNWREEARFKTIAVSNCQVERMPWEKLLWGSTGPTPGVPTTIVVPDSLLVHVKNVREVVSAYFGDGWHTLVAMQKKVRANSEAWQKLHPSWWIEEQFLESVAERRLDSHLKECLLNCLPNDKKVRSMDKALLGCRTLVTGPVTSAAPTICESSNKTNCSTFFSLSDTLKTSMSSKTDFPPNLHKL